MFTHSTPIPTNKDLQYVHDAPTVLIHPSVPADKFYHLVLKEKLWRSWSGDSFGVSYFDKHNDGSAKPFDVDIKGQAMSIRDRMIVQDSRTKAPVAVILGMFLKMEKTYKIYTFVPNVKGQAPSAQLTHSNRPLYEWATCKDKLMSIRKTMKTVDGAAYVMDGVGKVMTTHRQIAMSKNGRACMLASEKNIGIFKGNQWELKISPGIDPVLMVAFMAVMDEMNEDK